MPQFWVTFEPDLSFFKEYWILRHLRSIRHPRPRGFLLNSFLFLKMKLPSDNKAKPENIPNDIHAAGT